MNNLIKCDSCYGRGKRSMGGMESKCKRCEGSGKISAPVATPIPVVEIVPQVETVSAIEAPQPITEPIVTESVHDLRALAEMNPQLEAALMEPKMTKAAWNEKYEKIMVGIDAKMRNEMRTEYAKRQKPKPRKINQMAAQEGIVGEVDE